MSLKLQNKEVCLEHTDIMPTCLAMGSPLSHSELCLLPLPPAALKHPTSGPVGDSFLLQLFLAKQAGPLLL
jgi:hypothetical protein